jgi:hypothetical protein
VFTEKSNLKGYSGKKILTLFVTLPVRNTKKKEETKGKGQKRRKK